MIGIEMMLRQLGLGDVIEMARDLANDGTVQKIVAFAEGVDELNARLERIERALTNDTNPPKEIANDGHTAYATSGISAGGLIDIDRAGMFGEIGPD